MFVKRLPAAEWIRRYQRADLRYDLIAGATVAVMLVPQAMAYAMLAGLPPVVGLYASVAPVVVYALFGSSRQLAVGPVALVSLMVASGCAELAEPESARYVAIVLLLMLMVGIVQLGMGLFRVGFLVCFLSRAVVSGFMSAAALIIGASQLKHLLGIPLAETTVFGAVFESVRGVGRWHPLTVALAGISVLTLGWLKRRFPHFPSAMALVATATLAVWWWGLDARGVAVVGEVPRGLPRLSLPVGDAAIAIQLLPVTLAIAFVGFLESVAIAQSIAAREKYQVDPNQELRALGLANLAGAFFSGYPVTGGLSRTAVNYSAGAKTPLASLVTGGLVLLVLLFFTPLFYYLPKAVLAAIVLVAVAGLIEYHEGLRLYRLKRADGLCFLFTFGATLVFGIEPGVLAGVVLSLLLFIWRSAHPHMAELGYLADEGVYRNLQRFPDARTFPQALLVRVDASLYFANAKFVEGRLREWLAQRPEVVWVVFDMSGVNDMDATAISTLERLMADYQVRGVRFAFAGTKGPVRDLMARAGWTADAGRGAQYVSLQQAMEEILGP